MKNEKLAMRNETTGSEQLAPGNSPPHRSPPPTPHSLLLFSFLFSLFFFLFSCADMFQEKIPYAQTDGTLDDLFAYEVPEGDVKLAAPSEFHVASHYSMAEIRITWGTVRGAEYYMLERAVAVPIMKEDGPEWETPGEGDYEVLERFVYPGSIPYTDVILPGATLDSPEYRNKYFYRVSAFSRAKNYEESDPTEPLSGMLFRAPDGVRATGGTSVEYVDLSWEKSENAASYEIWRSDYPTGASPYWLRTVLGNQNWFRDEVTQAEQGKDFYYMITAVSTNGNKSLQTRPAYGYARIYGAPGRPDVRLAGNSGRGNSTSAISIEWDQASEPGAYYAVFRYSSVDSSLTQLTGNTTDPFWTDNQALRPGVYYYYKVQAVVDEIGSDRVLKSEISVTDADTESFILSPPDTVTAEKAGNGTVTIKWLPALGGESERMAYTYKVYADAAADGPFATAVDSGVAPQTDPEGYIAATGLSAANAFFRIATVNGAVESGKSPAVSPAPAAAVIQGASRYEFISPGEAANANGVYAVKITWKKPASADETPAFYHIQRSTKTSTGFSRITETALGASGPYSDVYSYNPTTEVYTFIDRNETARPGRKFYYRVLSLNQLEQGNFPSEEREGWGALTHTQYILEYNKTMTSALKKLTYMWKSGSTDKLGTETKYGSIGGTIYYNAALQSLGARIIIRLDNYADFYIESEAANGAYFTLTGYSNTTANMSSNGTMDGSIRCEGMYPGYVYYDRVEIKGGAAGGGTYGILPDGGFQRAEVHWSVIN